MASRQQTFLGLIALCACAGAARSAPPAYTIAETHKTGDTVVGVGAISGPSIGMGGRGMLKAAINNSGAWLLHVDTNLTGTETDDVILRSATGLTPYIREGISGYLSADYASTGFHALDLNTAGNGVFAMSLWVDDFSMDPTSGAYYNNSTPLFFQGDSLVATGLAGGTVWAPLDSSTRIAINDAAQVLVVSNIVESAVTKRAVILLQLNGSGAITGRTLIAKEGGPVGAGPATWTSISGGQHASALSPVGKIVFSGTTSTGQNGIYAQAGAAGAFVALQGGSAPGGGGLVWGPLAGSPVDVNRNGIVAWRATTGDSSGVYNESSDAGDIVDDEDHTYGNGALTRINGTLSNDHDVDMFRIKVTDAASFSATTEPNPGMGFPGAAFDTVVTVISEPGNGTRPRNQCDNVSAFTLQSTLGNTGVVTGNTYYLAIATPKSRCAGRIQNFSVGHVDGGSGNWVTDYFPVKEAWQSDPADVAVNAGLVYWPDPSGGVVGRATTGGAAQSDLGAPSIGENIAIDAVNGKLYWADRGSFPPGQRIRRSNLDGTVVEDVMTGTGFSPTNLTGESVTGLALDLASATPKLYWSKSIYGEINRCNLDGSSPERVIQDYGATGHVLPGATPTQNFAPARLAVDGAGGKIYWINGYLNTIERSNLNGTSRASIGVGAGASDLALDLGAGKVYWANTAGNKIQRSNLDGSAPEDVLATSAPVGLALDSGFVYWTNTVDRVIRRAAIAAPSPATVFTLAPDTGQRAPDGAASAVSFYEWTRLGTPAGGALPYSIKLTGATFQYPQTMIAKSNGQKVAATNDLLPGTSPDRITVLSSDTGPLRISDRGDVYWVGYYYAPTVFINYIYDGLFFNGERLLESGTTVAAASNQKIINFYQGPQALDISRDGTKLMVATNMQDPPYNFTPQRDNALVFTLTLPPACGADFNQTGTVTVQDLFDFLAAWFAGSFAADYNNSGSVTVQDLFDFLGDWFAQC